MMTPSRTRVSELASKLRRHAAVLSLSLSLGLGLGLGGMSLSSTAATPRLVVPASTAPLPVRVRLPGTATDATGGFSLAGDDLAGRVDVARSFGIGADGLPLTNVVDCLLTVPSAAGASGERRFTLERNPAGNGGGAGRFQFAATDGEALELRDGGRPVFAYRHGVTLKPGLPADRARSSYVHPLYGLDGEVLTDDFPEDHPHHRGVFWSWPHVTIDGQQYDSWMLKGITNRFERWLARETSDAGAVLGVENGWFVGGTKVVQERVWLTTYPVAAGGRAIDLECVWIPLNRPVSLAGAEGKSYGGISVRYAPGTNTVITTPLGNGTDDLYMTRLPWADLTRLFDGRSVASGAALFIGPDHPDYPPTWLTRHYGVLCHGWPGVEARTFPPGEPIHCRYRLWVHRGTPTRETLAQAYQAYTDGWKIRVE